MTTRINHVLIKSGIAYVLIGEMPENPRNHPQFRPLKLWFRQCEKYEKALEQFKSTAVRFEDQEFIWRLWYYETFDDGPDPGGGRCHTYEQFRKRPRKDGIYPVDIEVEIKPKNHAGWLSCCRLEECYCTDKVAINKILK